MILGPGVSGDDPSSFVDGVHTPGEWTTSPQGSVADCTQSLYITLDLGGYHMVSGVAVWHFYGNERSYCGQKIALSTTGAFAGEEVVVYDTGVEYGPTETADGNTIMFDATTAQFVRHWCSRSTSNAGVHFLEIDVYGDERQIIPSEAVELDIGALVIVGPGVSGGSAEMLVDNVHTPGEWTNSPYGTVSSCAETLYVTIDLGEVHNVYGVTIWHYYGDTRAYCGQKIALSTTGAFAGEEDVVYNLGEEFGPAESIDGNAIVFRSVAARYVRHYCSGSTANMGVHFLEVDVYGNEDPIVPEPVGLDASATVILGPGVSGDDPSSFVDGVHTPGEWTTSPQGSVADCTQSLYITLDLGGYHMVSGVAVWHFYGNERSYCGQKIALSTTGAFAGEEVVVYDTGVEYGPTETADGNTIMFDATTAQFVRHWCSRSTSNAGVHFLEIDVYGDERQIIPSEAVELDIGALVIVGPGVSGGSAEMLVDNVHTPGEWTNSPYGTVSSCAETLYVTIDLGEVHNVYGVTIWHYYGDTRAYCKRKRFSYGFNFKYAAVIFSNRHCDCRWSEDCAFDNRCLCW